MKDEANWDLLRVFKIVAEAGSMSAAAARLGESAPTISRRISDLEQDLNAELLKRTTRGVELTDAGRLLLRHANTIADAMDAIEMEVSDHDTPVEGKIHIATGDGLGPYWIARHLHEFYRLHPKIEIVLSVSDQLSTEAIEEADITIQFEEPKRHDLIVRKLGVLHYLCFASQPYLDVYGEPKSLFEFAQHRTLMHSGYIHQLDRWAPKTSDLKRLIDFALVTNSAAAMISVCETGGGIAVLPSYLSTVSPRLIPLNLPEIAPIQFWMTYTERVRRLPRGKAVLDWLRNIFHPDTSPWFREVFVHPSMLEEGRLPPAMSKSVRG